MRTKPYRTYLSDEQWAILEPLLPARLPDGRPREVSLREVLNAILYKLKHAVVWSDLPRDPIARFEGWLEQAAVCGVGALATFAAGLRQDGAAVRAALTLPWSSGQAEGQINRLKMLKRQMYGRAGFDLLRCRVLLAT